MATETADPRTFQSWEDAFQYPIPVVRKLEHQLRSNADENREKLRSLVGTSYRSLLDTAETIIDMEVRMEEVESKLSRVGQCCNARGLERISGNAIKMETHRRSRDADRYAHASQLSVLRNAPLVMTRLIKGEGSYLLIAKVLVTSRLLHKALSLSKNKPPIVDQLWEKLLSIRRKLLRRIDKRLANTTGEMASLVESMCAYALVTSSPPTDVLNHFHKVRLDKMQSELKQGGADLAKHGISALKLCIQTCLDTQAIFPRRLADALAKLKTGPLIQDPDVRALYELNLDVHDRWIGDEARNYTPWPRHDELQRPEAEKILQRWSKDVIAVFLKDIRTALDGEKRLKEVAHLRQELIETWILSGSRMAGIKSANVLDDLRDTMNDKLESIVRARTQTLQNVVTELTTRLDTIPSSVHATNSSLWDLTSRASELSNGAQIFKTAILNSFQGRDEHVIHITSTFDAWMDSVLEVRGIIKSMKEARWDDTFADEIDSSDDDDDLGDSKQTLLSSDDPKLLEETTQDALRDALDSLGQSFDAIVKEAVLPPEETAGAGAGSGSMHQAIFLLRAIREFANRLPNLKLHDKAPSLASPFTPDILHPLHTALAASVAQPAVHSYQKSLSASVIATSTSHILWDGNPPLPNQPSPSAFRFLLDLNASMARVGMDLWARGGVQVLKGRVVRDLRGVIGGVVQGLRGEGACNEATDRNGDENGGGDEKQVVHADTADDVKTLRDRKLKQLFFDTLYIQRFVAPTATADDGLAALVGDMGEDLDQLAVARLQKSTADYAKKTYLLFALLA